MSKHVTIALQPGEDYYREQYGILLESATEHLFTGPRIHNRSYWHVLQVWANKRRPDYAGQAEAFRDPQGVDTAEQFSFLWSARPSVIALQPQARRQEPGLTLALGDVVTLTIHDYPIGDFQCRARSLHNPHMVRVDTSSSASRQHYIETGDYLSPGEEV